MAGYPKYYILRTIWAVGDGKSFLKTMKALNDRVAEPNNTLNRVDVLNVQLGRITFAKDLARAIFQLLDAGAPFGAHGCTGFGAVKSWTHIAHFIFELSKDNGDAVVPVNSTEYYISATASGTSRPTHAVLGMRKIASAGFEVFDCEVEFASYVSELKREQRKV